MHLKYFSFSNCSSDFLYSRIHECYRFEDSCKFEILPVIPFPCISQAHRVSPQGILAGLFSWSAWSTRMPVSVVYPADILPFALVSCVRVSRLPFPLLFQTRKEKYLDVACYEVCQRENNAAFYIFAWKIVDFLFHLNWFAREGWVVEYILFKRF